MAMILKAIDPCLYEKLMIIHRANEIHRVQAETSSDKIEQEYNPAVVTTTIQDGGAEERSLIGSPHKEERSDEKPNDDVNADNTSPPDNNPTLRHHPVSPFNQLQARPIEGWTTVENIPTVRKTRKSKLRAPRKKFQRKSYKGKKRYRC